MAQGEKPTNPEDELQEALRDLERLRRAPAPKPQEPEPTPREEVEEAVRRIAEEQLEERARRARKPSPLAKAKWPVLILLSLAVVAWCVMLLLPEPMPPPAESATEAVDGFWKAVIAGKYQGATVYCPSLVDKYGSREQAARYLKEQFQANPPTVVRNVQLADTMPESANLIVNYEVIRRSGSPITGQAVVLDTKDPKQGYVIVAGI